MSRNCVMCDKEIDLSQDAYISGESLGEYWCEECTKSEIKQLKEENKMLIDALNPFLKVFEKTEEEILMDKFHEMKTNLEIPWLETYRKMQEDGEIK